MPSYSYDRLSGQDNGFLLWETSNLPMHVCGFEIFDAGPLLNDHGGIRFEEIKQLTESILHRIPRYRQKLQWVPGDRQAVWVDDPYFNIDYHFRHTSLPRPGTEEQLKRLLARIMEHQLDRSRPLWETWVVEGVEGDRFALINKIHHCILDGHGGVDLSQSLLSLTPDRDIREAPRFLPRPEPSSSELLVNEWRHRLATPIDGLSNLYRFVRKARDPVGEVGRQIRSLGEMASWKALPASETPMNGEIGPHRICDWRTMPLEQLKAVKKALGCTINDVVLTVTTTAVRELMQHRQVRPEELDFRVSTPVSVRPKGSEGDLGNHVSSWIIRLPLGEPDPLEQLEIVRASTQELKRSNQASAIELVNAVVDWMPFDLQAASRGTVNMIVSNVPGPPFPLYILGAEMQEIIPLPPLIDNVGLAIGLLSYNGQLSWGFNADYDRLPDLADFATGVVDAFERLAEAAGVDLEAVETTKQLPAPEGGELQSWLDPAVAGTPSPAEGEAEPVRTAVGAADG